MQVKTTKLSTPQAFWVRTTIENYWYYNRRRKGLCKVKRKLRQASDVAFLEGKTNFSVWLS